MTKVNCFLVLVSILFISCVQGSKSVSYDKSSYETRQLSVSFKEYWYNGEAEITSYELSQMRYGEAREGKAVLIFVKEDFLPDVQVKANEYNEEHVEVLKLNFNRDFATGIYPYHLMSSTFYPLQQQSHAIKLSASVQEWCGQQYTQLNNRKDFDVRIHSYFEGEADEYLNLGKDILENELWTQLRIDPSKLPTGNHRVIPDLNYNRLKHSPLKAYQAQLSLNDTSYTVNYKDLPRKLTIYFEKQFPYLITGWEEWYPSGPSGDSLSRSQARLIKTMKTAYWKQNSERYRYLRDSLNL